MHIRLSVRDDRSGLCMALVGQQLVACGGLDTRALPRDGAEGGGIVDGVDVFAVGPRFVRPCASPLGAARAAPGERGLPLFGHSSSGAVAGQDMVS